MTNNVNWLLPEGIEEILPGEALKLETLRRFILDDLQQREFQLVMPPVMEFVDALLTGTGEELDTQTYKFMDQHTHRMLGIRADMTPQIARIDAHYLSANEVNRLCYAGTVLRTQPTQMGGPRELLQIGAELFGVEDESADIEIIEAMLQTLSLSKVSPVTVSLGHVGIYRALKRKYLQADDGFSNKTLENRMFDILSRKSFPDLAQLQADSNTLELEDFAKLMKLQGGKLVLDQARKVLPNDAEIHHSLDQLETVVQRLVETHPTIAVHIDLADVLGYRYYTGLKFNAFVAGEGRAITKGGRYDRIGERFGRARPATGFSADLKALVQFFNEFIEKS